MLPHSNFIKYFEVKEGPSIYFCTKFVLIIPLVSFSTMKFKFILVILKLGGMQPFK